MTSMQNNSAQIIREAVRRSNKPLNKYNEAMHMETGEFTGEPNDMSKIYYKAKASNLTDYFLVEVRILSEPKRSRFGRKDVVIEPVKGKGTLKVDYHSLVVERSGKVDRTLNGILEK